MSRRLIIFPALLAGLLLAGAVAYHAAVLRYDVRPINGRAVWRTDRLTGTVTRCRLVDERATLDCTDPPDTPALRQLEELAAP